MLSVDQLWDTRFGFFWYNDREIFYDSQHDLDRKAAELAAAGINHVITFSCTHFRWSFRRHWDLISEALGRVVRACHAHGILVTEHHSSHLTFNPLTPEDEAWLRRVFRIRGSSVDSWPHFRADCDADPDVNGVPLSSLRQIDGRTGRWARSEYRGWCLCFNNPDYRRSYLTYLETLYALGIDGIMTDDVQWFGEGHACACVHCRRLFRERTGRELPPPGPEWEAWYGDYDDPSYVAWLDFRFRSNEGFHAAVKAHYVGLGLRPLRPNYHSDPLMRNWTAYILDTLPDLDWVFTECCYSTIIRYSWPHWAMQAAHHFAVGRWRNTPSMAMFYPDRPDSMLFTWALAMSWGQLFLGTREGYSLSQQEKVLRGFEREHAHLLRGAHRLSRLGFYDSRPTRDFYADAETRSLRGLRTWGQACYRRNVPFDLFLREELGRLAGYGVVVLNEVAAISDEELEAFRAFVAVGGALVWTGRTGIRDEHGVPRPRDFAGKLWGGAVRLPVPDGGQICTYAIGKGKLVAVPGDLGLGPLDRPHEADRWAVDGLRVPFRAVPEEEREVWAQITDLLVGLLPDGPDLFTENLPQGVVVTAFETADRKALTIHLVNAAGALDVVPGAMVGHGDVIPFPEHEGSPVRIGVRKPAGLRGRRATEARYLDPQVEGPMALSVKDEGAVVWVQVDPQLIRGYGLVEAGLRGSG